MKYTPILATLGFIISPDKTKVLMVHRTHRKNDEQFGKFNGLGGKMDRDEDISTCMTREIMEEAGITCTKMSMRGTVNWTGFGPNGEDWLGFIFRIDEFTGIPFTENEEGPLEWVDISSLEDLPMWEGDKYFLPLVFDDDSRAFHGYMPYENDKPLSWSYERF